MKEAQEDTVGEISKTTRRLAHLNLSPVQAEVLVELMNGNRTMAELTFNIFNSRYTDDRFEAYNSRTKRAVKALEKRGLVSKRRLLGREKPYGLTHHGTARIVSIVPEMREPAILDKWDMVVFPATLVSGVVALLTLNAIATNVFSLLLGISIVRSVSIMRRIV